MYKEELITSEVCIRCGSCCKLTVGEKGVSEKAKEWYNVIARQTDTINILDDGRIRFYCPKMNHTDDGLHLCTVYEERPRVCSDYNCFHMANLQGRPPENYEMIKGIIRQVHGENAI